MKLFCKNFGCKLNLAELQDIKHSALQSGIELTNQISDADLILVNTCNVTARAFAKIRHFIEKNQFHPKIIVTGCLPPEFLRQKHPANFIIVPASQKNSLPAIFQKINQTNSTNPIAADRKKVTKTRSFIKIQSGCNTRCTYCVIPFARGSSHSDYPDIILNKINYYLQQGYQEIVLTGTNLGQYQYKKTDLADLIDKIIAHAPIPRLRISSIDVNDISKKLLALYQKYSNIICPHFHLALQSGSDKILRAMKRPYNIKTYLAAVQKIRQTLPESSITTDIIVGFPGETDDDHQKTTELIRQVQFLKVHLFSYSDHAQTRASQYPDKIPIQIIKSRYKELLEVADQTRLQVLRRQIGQKFPVLVELTKKNDSGKNIFRGYSPQYFPVVIFSPKKLTANEIYSVKIEKLFRGHLFGQVTN